MRVHPLHWIATFITVQSFWSESYILHKSGGYEGLAAEDRICSICQKGVEDEQHVLLHVVCMTIFGFDCSVIYQQFLVMCMFIVNKKFLNASLEVEMIVLLKNQPEPVI